MPGLAALIRSFARRYAIAFVLTASVMVGLIVWVNYIIDAKLNSVERVDLNNTTGVERVRIRLSRPDLGEDLLDTVPSGDGAWVLNGNEVALPGAWHAHVSAPSAHNNEHVFHRLRPP